MRERFSEAIACFPPEISIMLRQAAGKLRVQEIRLRVGKPLAIGTAKGIFFVKTVGILTDQLSPSVYTCTKEDIEQSFHNMCEHSIYSHQEEIAKGYLTLRGGHRAGICGTAVYSGGEIQTLRDVSSISLRVAGQIDGAANPLVNLVGEDAARGLLIAGSPGSGKTTVLRDLAKQLSSGLFGLHRIAVVDERGELGASFLGHAQNDLGLCCDILNGYRKADGIQHAVRSLSPDIIICDEVGTFEEAQQMMNGFHSGVRFIATVHSGSRDELSKKRLVQLLLETGVFESIVQLKGRTAPGEPEFCCKAGDLLEDSGYSHAHFGDFAAGF